MTRPASYQMSDAAKARTAQIYDLMSDHYDDPALSFWDRHGRRTVERMQLAPGAAVLDVGCGTGAATLPAAQAVGPEGRVIGVDLSVGLLARAQRKADERGLRNVTFEHKDMTALTYPDNAFDAVTSVFSIFFVEDMAGLIAELWRMVKPGGKLAITVWAPPIFEPLDTLLRLCAAPELPDLCRGASVMDKVMFPHLLEKTMQAAGTTNVETVVGFDCQHLPTPDHWWEMAQGSGLRRIIAALDDEAAVRVRERMAKWIRENAGSYVATNVVYGIATKNIEA